MPPEPQPGSTTPEGRWVRFGVFEADLRERTLARSGRQVTIQDQPFRLLALLLAQPGALVTREEIRRSLWPDGTTVDFERGLNTAMNKLRAALGDSADSPRFIETVPRKGYRFLTPIEPERGARSAVGARSEWPGRSPPARRLAAALGLVAIVGVSAAIVWQTREPATRPQADRITLAVLPFADLSGRQDPEYFGTGLTEEMINRLGGLAPSQLGVIARSTVAAYRNTERPVAEIGAELGVDYVLEGSVSRSGDGVRITAQLIDVDDETHLWTERYESPFEDVLNAQRLLARRITDSLAVDVLHVSDEEPAVHPEAYEAYLRGLHYRDMLTEDGYREAIREFERAVALDPDFAPAHASMSACYCLLAGHGLEVEEPGDLMARTREFARRALALDPNLAEAHGTLGMTHLKYEWDWAAAARELRLATELNPSDPMAAVWYSFYLSSQGRHGDALDYAERARRADPVARIPNVNLAWQLYEARRYGEAIAAFESTLSLFPDFWIPHWGMGLAYLQLGQRDPALANLRRAVELSGGNHAALGALSLGYASVGEAGRSREILERLLLRAQTAYVPPAVFVPIYAALGDLDRAFAWLNEALELRSRSLVWIQVSHDFDALRGDPRYRAAIVRMGLAERTDPGASG